MSEPSVQQVTAHGYTVHDYERRPDHHAAMVEWLVHSIQLRFEGVRIRPDWLGFAP